MSTRALVTVLMLLGVCPGAAAQVQVQEFVAGDANPHAFFGNAAAAENSTVVVGAETDKPPGLPTPIGAAYVFELVGGSMRQIQKLVPPAGVVGSTFGNAVGLSGDWIAVGAEAEGSYKGAVYMFQRQGGQYVLQQRLVASDGVSGDSFAFALDLWEDRLIVGAPWKSTFASADGAAYVFELQGGTWSQIAKLVATTPVQNNVMGRSVAIRMDRAVAGAPGAWSTSGSAFVFEREVAGWIQKQRLLPSPAQPFQNFGSRIALDNEIVLVGANGTDGLFTNEGAIFVYERQGGPWVQVQDLRVTDPQLDVGLPSSMSFRDDRLLAGTPSDADHGTNCGSAYYFERSGGLFREKGKLIAGNASIGVGFGGGVAFFGSYAVVGAQGTDGACPTLPNCNSGSAYLFRLPMDSEQFCSCPTPMGPCANHDDHGGCRSSTGHGAVLAAAGSGSWAADDLELVCRWLPPSTPSVLLMGGGVAQAPFGDGRLCISAGPAILQRFPVSVASPGGAVAFGPGMGTHALGNFPRIAQLVPGRTWNFQLWYRDATGPCGSGTNLSNAVSVTFRD